MELTLSYSPGFLRMLQGNTIQIGVSKFAFVSPLPE